MELERFEDFLGLHAPTRWYKFATRVSSDICIQGEPRKRAELVRHVRAVAKLAGGIRVLRAKKKLPVRHVAPPSRAVARGAHAKED